ncbi:MAG TPA: hypothetical protein VH912_22140 [Streptosporangiaceae bacterium]|jgi:hypothetical protein
MSVVFRAEDEPAVSRADYWRHVVGDTFVPFDFKIVGEPGGYRAQLLTGDVGVVRVNEVTTPACEVTRTKKLIRRSDPEICKIEVQVRGRMVVEQGWPGKLSGSGRL